MMLATDGPIEKDANLALSDVSAKWIDKQANEVNNERSAMPFVNEFASEEDIKKYDLYGLWDEYHPQCKGEYYLGLQPSFTIDRDQNIFLMIIGGGREEYSNRTKALLWLNGHRVVVEVDKVDGLRLNPAGVKSNPYRVRWALVGVYKQKGVVESQEKIVEVLKEALTVYGFMGIYKQIPNTVVEFKF